MSVWLQEKGYPMRTRNLSSGLLLVAIFGIWGCNRTSGEPDGSGGDTASGGTTPSGGTTASGGTASGGTSETGGQAGGAGGTSVSNGGTTSTSTSTGPQGPCDIYAAEGGPCVAAHSTVRALLAAYSGNLYQLKKADGSTKDIGVLAPGGFAKSQDQDDFCGEDSCTISIIYDQSGQGNHLTKAPAGGAKKTADNEANAKALPITLRSGKVYGVHITPGVGYRNNKAKGLATGDNEETEYMVVHGKYFNGGCCFDYGNMETNSMDNGEGSMEAVYFGNCTIWGKGAGTGPWVMGDLENGLWAGDSSPFEDNKPVTFQFVTAMVKGDKAGANRWGIKVGNAQDGPFSWKWAGPRPSSRYNPMRKEGAIGLGTGGDNSNADQGNWFEGLMTTHYSSDKADDDVQANIVEAYKE
jgi:non-reducing end alpha-L-arabinofuranosidase